MNAPASEPLLLIDRPSQDHHRGVLRLTLNRPAARNALSSGLMRVLLDALEHSATDPSVKAIVIAANGPVFSAGHDLRELTEARADRDRGKEAFTALFTQCSQLMMAIVRHPRPVIAEVQGVATAAGCQLVASCDLAVAADTAKFATPGVDIGLFCSTPMVALSRNVPRKQAMAMLLTGQSVTAAEAVAIGLINRAVLTAELTKETMEMAGTIAAKPFVAVRTGKHAFYEQLEMPLDTAYHYAAQVMTENMLHAEASEGIGAFLEKRPPKWPSH
jgi:enoyl-CoA hydratase/carnithine racemase